MSESRAATILWLRQDLRLSDHPALNAALNRGGPVIPVFLYAPQEEGDWTAGSASRWWLHQSLDCLQDSLRLLGSRLNIRRGSSLEQLRQLVRQSGAKAVFWSRRYEPQAVKRDSRIKSALREEGIEARSFNGSLLFEPLRIKNSQGNPFQVFTPFWKHCRNLGSPQPLPPPRDLPPPVKWPNSLQLQDLQLEPEFDWAPGLRRAWNPGCKGAEQQLKRFLEESLDSYPDDRDRPGLRGVSRLSPYLHFGEISPRQVWQAVQEREGSLGRLPSDSDGRLRMSSAAEAYLRQLFWREFAFHLLFHFPRTPERPLREKFEKFPWTSDPDGLKAWQKGRTGYPMVDAGMRELWATGWMHNRTRMITASFLVKHLLIHWIEGARWFWDTLVDADLANNTLGWQWTAGCGADAAPYFRIFNPVAQGRRYDPEGAYVRRWVPEIARLPDKYLHQPWEAPAGVLEAAGVKLGTTYPTPIVDHAQARQRALDALKETK